ncbi:WXG100 family type VII secretion target [Arthrobacter globiformis]|uniref:WXG100 family type VII secretion target n=1 Tax=Arthrobacter globiformis TaxID=1665 RepID=UPI0027D80302|nr:WXG100 family type VII secretion target [Arthrobacter globiformis]
MSGNLWGADVAQLRTLAQQFGKVSDDLMQTSLHLTNQINSNPSWKGNDATQFRSDWNGNHRALIQRTVRALNDETRRLLDNANEQEKASDAAPGSGGGPVTLRDPGGALAGVLGGGIAALRAGMNVQKYIKAPLTLAKHVGQYSWVLKNRGSDVIKPFLTKGRHRLGGPVFEGRHLWQSTAGNAALEKLLKSSGESSRALRLIDNASDIASLKNLHEYIPPLERFEGFFAEKSKFGVGKSWEWLGKSGLARGLGWAGVGFSAYDSVNSFANGDVKGGLEGIGKTALGIGSFMPPPVGTVCQVASVGILVYENWDTISSVGKNIGEGIVNAVKDPGKFVSDTKDTLVDAGKSVGKFLGLGD